MGILVGSVVRAWDVLGPCPSFDTAASANDNSVVLRITMGRRAALLTGDAEAHQEARLTATHGERLRADLLKVGHHGSRTSTAPEWLRVVDPSVAMISSGVRNRFGHPHEVTLKHLQAADALILRTDRGGAAHWWTDGEEHGWRHNRTSWHPVSRGNSRSPP